MTKRESVVLVSTKCILLACSIFSGGGSCQIEQFASEPTQILKKTTRQVPYLERKASRTQIPSTLMGIFQRISRNQNLLEKDAKGTNNIIV